MGKKIIPKKPRRKKLPKSNVPFHFSPKDGHRIIATILKNNLEEVDKGIYEVSLHQNKYTVVLKDVKTGEVISLMLPLTRHFFEMQVNLGNITWTEEPVKSRSKKKDTQLSSKSIVRTPSVLEDDGEEEEVTQDIEGIEDIPEPEELKNELEEGDEASE